MRGIQGSLKEVLKKFEPFNALTTEQQDDIVQRTSKAARAHEQTVPEKDK